jgi:hypothetical protein
MSSTTPLPPPRHQPDLIRLYNSYFDYLNQVEEDATALKGSDFESILDDFKELLDHVRYSPAQSQEVFSSGPSY